MYNSIHVHILYCKTVIMSLYLPNSTNEKTKDKQLEVQSANERVVAVMQTGQSGRKRPSSYSVYSPELRAKIGKFAAESGLP